MKNLPVRAKPEVKAIERNFNPFRCRSTSRIS